MKKRGVVIDYPSSAILYCYVAALAKPSDRHIEQRSG